MGFYIVMYLYLPHQPFTMMLLHRNNDLFLSSIGIMQHKISTCGTIFDRERGVDNGYRVDLGMIFCACLCELLQIDSQLIFISLWQTLRANFTVDKRIKLSFQNAVLNKNKRVYKSRIETWMDNDYSNYAL